MTTLKPSTIAAVSVTTLATGLAAYAVYFDYKRRHDPEFRRKLNAERRKQARAAKEETEGQKNRERREIRQMVDEANEAGYPTDNENAEMMFTQCISAGEKAQMQTGQEKESALLYFKAWKVYPDQAQLMGLYDKMIPKNILDILAEMIAYDKVLEGSSSTNSSGGVE